MRLEPIDGEEIFLIHDLVTPDECDAIIARSESNGFEDASVGGEMIPQLRNNGRAFLDDPALASDLWRRSASFFPRRGGWTPSGLDPRFRVYRYEADEQFGPHYDGRVRRGDDEESRLTFMIYLSEVEDGGETKFYRAGGVEQFAVRPVTGRALVFDHLRLHEGAAVRSGRKYVLRTDVFYRRTPST